MAIHTANEPNINKKPISVRSNTKIDNKTTKIIEIEEAKLLYKLSICFIINEIKTPPTLNNTKNI